MFVLRSLPEANIDPCLSWENVQIRSGVQPNGSGSQFFVSGGATARQSDTDTCPTKAQVSTEQGHAVFARP